MDRTQWQFGKLAGVIDEVMLVDRQDDTLGFKANFQGIIDPEQQFQHHKGHQAAQKH